MASGFSPSRREFLAGAGAAFAAGAGCSRDLNLAPQPAPPAEALNVVMFGALGDGVTDDTAAIQAALDAVPPEGCDVLVPGGTWMLDPQIGLYPRSGTRLRLQGGARLRALPYGSIVRQSLVRVYDVADVTIEGGMIDGAASAGWSNRCQRTLGIDIRAAQYIRIAGVRVADFLQDGIYLGGAAGQAPPRHVVIEHCELIGNQRQGISVTHGDQVRITGCYIARTSGAAPSSGIDLEPNNRRSVTNVQITGNRFEQNAGYGVLLVGQNGPVADVLVDANTTTGNAQGGLRILLGTRVTVRSNVLHESVRPAIVVDVSSTDVVLDGNQRPGNGAVITDDPTPPNPERPPGGGNGCIP